MPQESLSRDIDPDLCSVSSSSEDFHALQPLYQSMNFAEGGYHEPQTEQVDAQYHDGSLEDSFCAIQSDPEYVVMNHQTSVHLQHQSGMDQVENGTEHVYVDDHDAQGARVHHDYFELEGQPYVYTAPTAENGPQLDDGRPSMHDGYRGPPHQVMMGWQNNICQQYAEPTFPPSRHEPWNILEVSRQAPTNAYQSMRSDPSPSNYQDSTGMPNHTEHSIPIIRGLQASNAYPGLHHSREAGDLTMGQPLRALGHSEYRRMSDISGPSLSPNRYSGHAYGPPMAMTPPESRIDRCDLELLSPNGSATSSNGLLSSTPSMYSETSASCPDTMPCPYEGCTREFSGKYRRGTLHRHLRHKHRTGQDSVEQEKISCCQVPGCGKDYMRQDALLKHQRNKHPELGIPAPMTRK